MNLEDLEKAEAEVAALNPLLLKASVEFHALMTVAQSLNKLSQDKPDDLGLKLLLIQKTRETAEAAIHWGQLGRKIADLGEPALRWLMSKKEDR